LSSAIAKQGGLIARAWAFWWEMRHNSPLPLVRWGGEEARGCRPRLAGAHCFPVDQQTLPDASHLCGVNFSRLARTASNQSTGSQKRVNPRLKTIAPTPRKADCEECDQAAVWEVSWSESQDSWSAEDWLAALGSLSSAGLSWAGKLWNPVCPLARVQLLNTSGIPICFASLSVETQPDARLLRSAVCSEGRWRQLELCKAPSFEGKAPLGTQKGWSPSPCTRCLPGHRNGPLGWVQEWWRRWRGWSPIPLPSLRIVQRSARCYTLYANIGVFLVPLERLWLSV